RKLRTCRAHTALGVPNDPAPAVHRSARAIAREDARKRAYGAAPHPGNLRHRPCPRASCASIKRVTCVFDALWRRRPLSPHSGKRSGTADLLRTFPYGLPRRLAVLRAALLRRDADRVGLAAFFFFRCVLAPGRGARAGPSMTTRRNVLGSIRWRLRG